MVIEGRGRSKDSEGVSRSEYETDFRRARGKKPRSWRDMRAISMAAGWCSRRIQESWIQGSSSEDLEVEVEMVWKVSAAPFGGEAGMRFGVMVSVEQRLSSAGSDKKSRLRWSGPATRRPLTLQVSTGMTRVLREWMPSLDQRRFAFLIVGNGQLNFMHMPGNVSVRSTWCMYTSA